MIIVGITTVLDEVGIIGHTARHLLNQGVDRLIVSDGGSTDGTLAVLADLPDTTVLPQEGPLYQDTEMTRLAHLAMKMGATWVVPFDADEFWCGLGGVRLVDVAKFVDGQAALSQPIGAIAGPVLHYISWDRRHVRTKLGKMMFKPTEEMRVEWGNHNVTGIAPTNALGIVVREYQYRSYAHFNEKINRARKLYESAEFPQEYGSHLRRLVVMDDNERRAEWKTMNSQPFVVDPIPYKP